MIFNVLMHQTLEASTPTENNLFFLGYEFELNMKFSNLCSNCIQSKIMSHAIKKILKINNLIIQQQPQYKLKVMRHCI